MSLCQPARVLGFLVGGLLSEKLGRKKSLILISGCQILTSVCIAFTSSFLTLLLAMCFSIFSLCLSTNPCYTFITEISLIRLRSSLTSFATFQVIFGWTIGICLGLVVPLKFYAIALCAPNFIFIIFCWNLPESPVWLLRSNRETEARESLQLVRGENYDVNMEIEEFQRILKDDDSSLTCCSLFMDKRQSTTSRATSVRALSDVYYNALEADSVSYFIAIIFQHSTLIKTEYAAILYQVIFQCF